MTDEQNFTIRQATRDDARAVAALWSVMADQHRRYDADGWCWSDDAEDKWLEHFTGHLDNTDAVCLVAQGADGELLAFVQAVVKDSPPIFATRRHGEVWDLVVRPEHRRKGIGAKLMAAAIAGLKERGAEDVKLHVAIANEAAIKLYERLGFRRIMYRMHKKL